MARVRTADDSEHHSIEPLSDVLLTEVPAPVFDPAIDSHNPATDEAELTPIFHALARRRADPVEHFRRDPLRAPLPSLGSSVPALARMLLHAVPSMRAESRSDRAAESSRDGAEESVVPRPGTGLACPHHAAQPGGRHRALRAVRH